MSGVAGYKYHVIHFLEVPYKDIAEYVCVPRSWVSCGDDFPLVKVSYPVEEPSVTENRVMNKKNKSRTWKLFSSIVRHSTDDYEIAKLYANLWMQRMTRWNNIVDLKNIQDKINELEKNNEAMVNEKTSISRQNATSGATIDNDAIDEVMIDAPRWCVSSSVEEKANQARKSAKMNIIGALGLKPTSNDNNISTNTTTFKHKALPDHDEETHNKRFRVNEPDESDNRVTRPSSKALDGSSKSHYSPTPENSDEALYTQKTMAENFNDNSTHSLDPKIIAQLATLPVFAKCCMLIQAQQELFDNPIFKELINKVLNKNIDGSASQNNDPVACESSDTIVGAPKLNKVKRNKKPLEQKYTDDDVDKVQPIHNKSCSKRTEKVVLPQVNNRNHSEESDYDNSNDDYQPVNDTNHSEESDSDSSNDDYQPVKKKSSPERIKKVVMPPVNSANHSDESDFENSDDDYQPAKNKSSTKRIKEVVLPPVNDANHSEESDSDNSVDDCQHVNKKGSSKQIKEVVMPPMNDANHSEESDSDNSIDDCQHVNEKGSAKRIKEVVLPPMNDANHSSEDSDSDNSVKDASHSEESDFDFLDDVDQPLRNKSSKQIKKVVLPPVNGANHSEESDFDFDDDDDHDDQLLKKLPREYDANDSRWTLNYLTAKSSGIIELIPNTGVYISSHQLCTFKRFSGHRRSEALTRSLLSKIFTTEALKVCSLPGTRAKAKHRDGTNVRPALDKHALKVIINYVTDHAKKEGLPHIDTRSILKIMRDEMEIMNKYRRYRRNNRQIPRNFDMANFTGERKN